MWESGQGSSSTSEGTCAVQPPRGHRGARVRPWRIPACFTTSRPSSSPNQLDPKSQRRSPLATQTPPVEMIPQESWLGNTAPGPTGARVAVGP